MMVRKDQNLRRKRIITLVDITKTLFRICIMKKEKVRFLFILIQAREIRHTKTQTGCRMLILKSMRIWWWWRALILKHFIEIREEMLLKLLICIHSWCIRIWLLFISGGISRIRSFSLKLKLRWILPHLTNLTIQVITTNLGLNLPRTGKITANLSLLMSVWFKRYET